MGEAAAAGGGFSHLALFYRDEAEYLAALVAFARDGVASGEPVLVAVPGHRVRLLRSALNGQAAHVAFADMTVTGRNPARIISAVQDFIAQHSGQPVRYIGEPAWAARPAAELREAVRHEELVNLAFAGAAVTILCPYDAAALPSWVIDGAQRTHPVLLDRGQRHASPGYVSGGNIPAECSRPLPAPPAQAECIAY